MVLNEIIGIGYALKDAGARAIEISSDAVSSTIDFVKNFDYNPKNWYHAGICLLRDTPAEVLILAIGAGLTVGIERGFNESARASKIPIGFSEITQVERDARNTHEEIEPFTYFLMTANDSAMKPFEAWNLAQENTLHPTETFARELEIHVDPALKTHTHNLPDLLEKLPARSAKARASFKDFIGAMQKVKFVNQNFSDAWYDTHVDNYHTECTTTTDSKGDSHTECHPVYDDTTHTYTYYQEHGEKASIKLGNLLKDYPDLHLKEKLRTASQTNAEGEYAAEKSRKGKDGGKKYTPFDFMEICNTWATGSTLTVNLPFIYDSWRDLHVDGPAWKKAKSTAQSISYKTYSHSDAGPREFQIAEETLSHGRLLETSIEEIVDGIDFAEQNAPILEAKIREFIGVTLDKKPGSIKKLRNEIISLSKELYTKNFKGGFDVYGFRYGVVALWVLGAIICGGALGFAADRTTEKYDTWDKLAKE